MSPRGFLTVDMVINQYSFIYLCIFWGRHFAGDTEVMTSVPNHPDEGFFSIQVLFSCILAAWLGPAALNGMEPLLISLIKTLLRSCFIVKGLL